MQDQWRPTRVLLLIVAAEFISAKSGIGYLIWTSWQTFAVEEMYVGLITISALGLVPFALFDVLERWLIPWRVPGPDGRAAAAQPALIENQSETGRSVWLRAPST